MQAVNKPPTMSSAALGNEIKRKLTNSNLFKPVIDEMLSERQHYKRTKGGKTPKSMRGAAQVKIGHGGTLDPGASGVISFGVGNGTKALGFLQKGALKGYEAVMLFGAATDSFDSFGKVVGRKSWEDVTEKAVENAMEGFRGKIMQRPSVYSALKRGGQNMYEYAREGKHIPELEKREMFVTDLELVEWMEGGTHDFHWPDAEIENYRKEAFVKVLRFDEIGDVQIVAGCDVEPPVEEKLGKRKRQKTDDVGKEKRQTNDTVAIEHGATNSTVGETNGETQPETESNLKPRTRCPAPAARIRMTVSSGFYVRSLCHDLGVAVGSLASMSTLVRTRQACFDLGVNTIAYEDFEQDESVWGPKVAKELNAWGPRLEELQKEAGYNDNEAEAEAEAIE